MLFWDVTTAADSAKGWIPQCHSRICVRRAFMAMCRCFSVTIGNMKAHKEIHRN